MENEFKHEELSQKLAKVLAGKANAVEARKIYEETMFEKFISMDKCELSEILWHR